MKNNPALTLIELILVMGILVIVGVPAILSVSTYRQKQALIASADKLSAVLSSAHIYAREVKEQKMWGVRYRDSTSYEMISGNPSSPALITPNAQYGLTAPTTFKNGYFDVWFTADTGEAMNSKDIVLKNPRGNELTVSVSKAGVVEVK